MLRKLTISIMTLSLLTIMNPQILRSFSSNATEQSQEVSIVSEVSSDNTSYLEEDLNKTVEGEDIRTTDFQKDEAVVTPFKSLFNLSSKENISITNDVNNPVFPYKDSDENYLVIANIIGRNNTQWYVSVDYQTYLNSQEKKLHLLYVVDEVVVEIIPISFDVKVASGIQEFVFSNNVDDLFDMVAVNDKGTKVERQFKIMSESTQIRYVDETGVEILEADAFDSVQGLSFHVEPLNIEGYSYLSNDGIIDGTFSNILINQEYITLTSSQYGYEYHIIYFSNGTAQVWVASLTNQELTSQKYIINWGETHYWVRQDWIDIGLPRMNGGSMNSTTFTQVDVITFVYQKNPEVPLIEETSKNNTQELPKTGELTAESLVLSSSLPLGAGLLIVVLNKKES